jgi:cardiolipin synthase A/B
MLSLLQAPASLSTLAPAFVTLAGLTTTTPPPHPVLDWLAGAWALLLALLWLTLVVGAIVHCLLNKRDALFWVLLIAFLPLIGAISYFLFGVNRIVRAGQRLRNTSSFPRLRGQLADAPPLSGQVDPPPSGLVRSLCAIASQPAVAGNQIQLLENGGAAYPAMISAIESATTSISFASYIFELKGPGEKFVAALAAAAARGVQIRVLVDDAGTRYAWPPVTGALHRCGVPVRRFMPNHHVARLLTFNLRNHRKILVVDGRFGFTGGMNIRNGYVLPSTDGHHTTDLHFQVEGPVVAQLQEVFAEDWAFCSGELLTGPAWFPELAPVGPVIAQGIADGPDEDLEVMATALVAAIGAARRRVRIITPYFLPDETLVAALNLAALRGVKVEIILPSRNNIPLVLWASRTTYRRLLDRGCKILETPPPFDHTKAMTVDGTWCCIGSTNWDPRSLRLNFEFNLACFDTGLTEELDAVIDRRMAHAHQVTTAEVASWSRLASLRNGLANLFRPML